MIPETWYALDGQIHIKNPDGTETVLQTSWQATRQALAQAEYQKRLEAKAAVQENQIVKKVQESKKRGGRGC